MREFNDMPAARESTPILVGIMGPSGGGKTFSALRLATGIQRVSGGDIFGIDTEARRMLHYSDKFKFRHVDFKAPFGPLDYLAAIEHCVNKGAKVVIVDSMSHEHEGTGGVLDQHDTIMNGVESKSMLAWKKPKMERRKLINSILQMNVNFIFCFRAKEKIKLTRNQNGKIEPQNQGFMPIAGEEFLFEQTVNCLLLPKANGIPEWNPLESGERMMTKLPEQFFKLFAQPKSLDEETGQRLAEWAKGGVSRPVTAMLKEKEAHPTRDNEPFDQPDCVESEHPDDQDYAESKQEEKKVETPAGALVIEGEIEAAYTPKEGTKQPWKIKIGGVSIAMFASKFPTQAKWLEGKPAFKGKRFRADYTSVQSGQYTNNTLVNIQSI
jgi:AAA domain